MGGAAGQPGARAEVAGGTPSVIGVALLLRHVIEAHPSLTRVHFHALAFHVIAYSSDAMGKVWRGRKAAVAAGSLAATLEACHATLEGLVGERMRVIAPLANISLVDPRTPPSALVSRRRDLAGPFSIDSTAPVLAWRWGSTHGGDIYFAMAPVAICAAPVSTVGLGDAISASGLGVDAMPRAKAAVAPSVAPLPKEGTTGGKAEEL